MVVGVTDVEWDQKKSRRAYVTLADTDGNRLGFVDYAGADISTDWTVAHRYRISRCHVQDGSEGTDFELAPSKRTQIEPLGPVQDCTRILVVGDTHIGRTSHPKTGEDIDPIGSFSAAVDYGIDQNVDAVVHAGDIFHETATQVGAFFTDGDVFEPLASAEIPFYYVRGNHSAAAGDAILSKRDGTVAVNLDTAGTTVGPSVRLFGIDHHPEGDLPWADLEFPGSVPESVSILVVHQTLEQLSGRGPKSVDLSRIRSRYGGQFDCIVAGHHHDAMHETWRGIPVLYTGAAERMSTNNDSDDRVAWLLTVVNGRVACEQYKIP